MRKPPANSDSLSLRQGAPPLDSTTRARFCRISVRSRTQIFVFFCDPILYLLVVPTLGLCGREINALHAFRPRVAEVGVVPAYSLAEPYETLTRRQKQRKRLTEELDAELGRIARTATYAERLDGFCDVTALLMNIGDEESKRLEEVCSRLTKAASDSTRCFRAERLDAIPAYPWLRAARRARLLHRSFASRTGPRIAELLSEQEFQGFRRPDGRGATRTSQLQAVTPIRFRQPFHSQRPALKDRVPPKRLSSSFPCLRENGQWWRQ